MAHVQDGIVELFVSPQGDDRWSGRLATPRRADGPFATLSRVIQEIRRVRRESRARAIRVVLRAGTYFLHKPLVIGPSESGTAEDRKGWRVQAPAMPVTFAAYPSEVPIISGGRQITGWRVEQLGERTVWVADIPKVRSGNWWFQQLFVNGERRFRPRLPKAGTYRVARLPPASGKPDDHQWMRGGDSFFYRDDDLRADWHCLQDVEVVALHFWIESRMWLQKLDGRRRRATLDRKSRFRLSADHLSDTGADYYVENVFEALDEPGQWYLDRRRGRLYYLPMPGEVLESAQIIAPAIDCLVRLEGQGARDKKTRRVEEVHFEGITFAHSEWHLPTGIAGFNQAANGVPGAIVLRDVRSCSITGCTFTHLGGYALELAEDCDDVRVQANTMTDLGAGGIRVWHGCRACTISDNEIGPGGQIFHSGIGLLVGRCHGIQLLHNHIHHFFYTGISIGWSWGYSIENAAFGNVVEYNHIHDIGQGMLSDMGGVYLLGVQTGTRVRNNVIHDINSRGYGGWGIYPDEGSSDLLIENNIVYRTKSAGFHQHYGRRNLVQNNVFAFGRDAQIQQTRRDTGPAFIFCNNIVYFKTGQLISGNHGEFMEGKWTSADVIFERNLYFDSSRRPVRFEGRTFRQWQKLGLDRASLIVDPLFVNPEAGDFRLKPSSPALRLGFIAIDLSDVGPRQSKSSQKRSP